MSEIIYYDADEKIDKWTFEESELKKAFRERKEFKEKCNNLQNQLQQKENIIKEVRKHLQETINKWEDHEQFYEVVEEDKYILEILNKESE